MHFCDKFVRFALLFLLLFTPLAFGSVHSWAYSLVEGVVALMVLAWALKIWFLREASLTPLVESAWRYALPLVLFVGFVLFQMTPLPPPVLRVLSPATYDLYRTALPGWPEERPYGELVEEVGGQRPEVGGRGEELKYPLQQADNGGSGEVERGRSLLVPDVFPEHWRSLSIAPMLSQADLLKLSSYALLFFFVLLYPAPGAQRDPGHRLEYEIAFVKPLLYAILCIGFLVATLGFLNLFTWNGRVLWFFVPYDASGGGGGLRAAAPFIAPPSFANYLAMTLPLTVTGLVWWSFLSPGRLSAGFRVFCGFGAFIVFCGILLSLSRAGWMAALIGVGVLCSWMLLSAKRDSWIARTPVRRVAAFGTAGFCLVLLVALLFVGPRGQESLDVRLQKTATEPTSLYGRFAVWRDSIDMVQDFPVFGVGLGAWPDLFPRYQDAQLEGFYRETHNDYLELLVETGFVGVLLLGWFFGTCVDRILRNSFVVAPDIIPVIAALFGGMSAMAFHEIFDFNLQIPANAILFTLFLALSLRLSFISPARASAGESSIRCHADSLTALALGSISVVLFLAAFSQPMGTYPYFLRKQASPGDALAAVHAFPANAEAHVSLFEVSGSRMDESWQLEELERILTLAPGNTAVRDAFAAHLLADGSVERALAEVTRSVAEAPSVDRHFYLTRELSPVLFPNEQDAVIAGFQKAIASGHPMAFEHLAEFYQRAGRLADRAGLYEDAAAVSEDPAKKADYLLAAADAAIGTGDFPRAEKLLRIATNLKPDDTALFSRLIEKVYIPQKNLVSAQEVVTEGIGNGADALSLEVLLAEVAQSSGQQDIAADVLRKALKNGSSGVRSPRQRYRTYMRLARVAADVGLDGVQEQALEKAIELQPASYDALMEVGRIHAARKDYNRAAFYYRNATRANRTSPQAFASLAQIEEARFRFAEADKAYAEAVRLAPRNDKLKRRYEAFKQRIAKAKDS